MKREPFLKKMIISSSWLTNIGLKFYSLYLKIGRKDLRLGHNVKVGFSSKLLGSNYVGSNSIFTGSEMGYASYISENSYFQQTKIGKYCSIGPNVRCVFGKHPTRIFVSTHPAFFSVREQVGFTYVTEQQYQEFAEKQNGYSITIGNDVWIGANVTLLDGVTIGDGAIIAANSLVNKDVEPYTIVGGVAIKVIGKRFEDSEISFLLGFKWWMKEESWIIENISKFRNISDFKKNFDGNP